MTCRYQAVSPLLTGISIRLLYSYSIFLHLKKSKKNLSDRIIRSKNQIHYDRLQSVYTLDYQSGWKIFRDC